jgi:8-oxo-dGTP pyrophosphatase MutT (NUDIX family)
VRETREETGVDLLALRASVRDLGEHPYYSGKRLHFFSVETQELPDTQGMFCVSQVHADAEEPYPEVDDFRYCPLVEAVDKLNKSQAEAYANVVLPALGLADDSESAS